MGTAGDGLTAVIVTLFELESEETHEVPAGEIDVVIPGDSAVRFTIRGWVSFSTRECKCSSSGIRGRHPVVSPGPDPEIALVYDFETGPPRTHDAKASIGVIYPGTSRIRAEPRPEESNHGRVRGESETGFNYGRRQRWMTLYRPRTFARGGPFVGVGGGWNSARAIRLRAGYELAAPRWLVFAGAVETDTTDLRFVPTISAMTKLTSRLVVPGAAFGLGAPIQALPRARLGIRAQAEVFWRIVGIVGAADVYPERGGARVVGSLFGQLSF